MVYQLAQLNIAQFKRAATDPVNQDFFDNIDSVNVMADWHSGFIWRLIDDDNDSEKIFGENTVVNVSKWQDVQSLFDFVYKNPQHLAIMSRRHEWFSNIDFSMVLWWVDEREVPTVAQARQRLDYLTENGPSEYAFTFSQQFNAPS